MKLEIIMLSEISQSQRQFCMFSVICGCLGKIKDKNSFKVMKGKWKILRRWKGKEKMEEGRGRRYSNKRGNYDQSTLYSCMEVS
jgi:hypothetical protein